MQPYVHVALGPVAAHARHVVAHVAAVIHVRMVHLSAVLCYWNWLR